MFSPSYSNDVVEKTLIPNHFDTSSPSYEIRSARIVPPSPKASIHPSSTSNLLGLTQVLRIKNENDGKDMYNRVYPKVDYKSIPKCCLKDFAC
ncbi:hypothetical protein AKJ16_DCAP25601 [Drosera capensis]